MAGLLAGLDAEVVAVLFLIALLAAVIVLRPLTTKAAGAIPGIGSVLGPAVDTFWLNLVRALAPGANSALEVFTSSLQWVTGQWSQLVATVVGFAQLAYAADFKIATGLIPHAIGIAEAKLEALVNTARAYSLGLVKGAEVAAVNEVAAAEAKAAALAAQATAGSVLLFQTAEANAAHLIGVAEADAVALATAERAFAIAGIATAEGYAQTLLSQAIAQMHAIEAGILGQLGGVSIADQEALRGQVNTLRQEIADASKALSAAAAGSIAAVALDVAAIKALRCIKFCNELGAIGEFSSLLDIGLVLVLVEAARENPKGLQDFIAGTVAPLLRAEIPS